MEMYLYLSSFDSSTLHVTNTWSDFTVELPLHRELTGSWECALVEFQLTEAAPVVDPLCVCTNICQESCMGDTQLPILRCLSWKGRKREAVFDFPRPHYVAVKLNILERVRVYITSPHSMNEPFGSGRVTCTLHFRRTG